MKRRIMMRRDGRSEVQAAPSGLLHGASSVKNSVPWIIPVGWHSEGKNTNKPSHGLPALPRTPLWPTPAPGESSSTGRPKRKSCPRTRVWSQFDQTGPVDVNPPELLLHHKPGREQPGPTSSRSSVERSDGQSALCRHVDETLTSEAVTGVRGRGQLLSQL